MNQPIISASHISKQFGQQSILEDVSLIVPKGKIIGISGHNGSGKSIFLRIVCGLLRADGGEVFVFGQKIGRDVEFPDRTGAIIDGPGFISHLTGKRNLKLLAMIQNKIDDKQIQNAMVSVGLEPDNKVAVSKYSTGMKQRLALAQAIMEKPELLILDEPTSGIDREGISEIHALLQQLQKDGCTILLTSHSTQELETICDEVYEMLHGRLQNTIDV